MVEKGRRSDITNLSLQDEEKLSYVSYFEALKTRLPRWTVSETSQLRTSSACSNFKTHEKYPSLIDTSQKQSFKSQATGSPHLAGVSPIFRKYGTK